MPIDKPETLFNLAAERETLGACFRWPNAVDDVGQILTESDFGAFHHQRIFRSILKLRQAGKAVDLVNVYEAALASGDGGDVTTGVLAEIWEAVPTGALAKQHARIVKEYALLRALKFVSVETLKAIESRSAPAESLIEDAERAIFALSEQGTLGTTVSLRQAIYDALQRLDHRRSGGGELADVVPSGFIDLDRQLAGGLHAAELVLIGARTSVGKSALAVNIVRNAAKEGNGVFIASIEMSRIELAERFLVSAARVDGQNLRRGVLSVAEEQALMEAGDSYREANVEIDDSPQQSVFRIAANARRIQARKGLRMVVVDYLQFVDGENRREQRYLQLGEISRGLKRLARELSVPVVAMVQVNRGPENRADTKPRLSDLREAGNLEQDADTVLLLRDGDDEGVLVVDVAKQRNGPKGEILLTFQKKFQRMDNYTMPFAHS